MWSRPMSRALRPLPAVVAVALVAVLLWGCAAGASRGNDHGTAVPVTDVKTVAGRWSGLLEISGRRHEDFVEVTISPGGTYEVHGARTVGILDAQGRVEAAGGTLRFLGSNAATTGTLYEKDGRRTLVIDGRSQRDVRVNLRLHPAR
jgi:hypothetical protein